MLTEPIRPMLWIIILSDGNVQNEDQQQGAKNFHLSKRFCAKCNQIPKLKIQL